jgi:siroheme synthase-like protein
MLRLTGKRVLVVGGGDVAARKVEGLLAAGARVTVVAPEVVPTLADREGVVVKRRAYVPGELTQYWLAVACTDDPAVQQQVFDDGERLGVWVNAADDPERCSFTLPAVARRGPVVLAVSSSGTSPALAQALRDRAASSALPDGVERVAAELAQRRQEIKAAGGSTEALDWRPIVDELLDGAYDGGSACSSVDGGSADAAD